MADLRENGHPSPEFRIGICQYLQDTYALGQESIVKDSNICHYPSLYGRGCCQCRVPSLHRCPLLRHYHLGQPLHFLGLQLPWSF